MSLKISKKPYLKPFFEFGSNALKKTPLTTILIILIRRKIEASNVLYDLVNLYSSIAQLE